MVTQKNGNVAENTHGGARPGAGRPKLDNPRKAHSFSCTDSEAEIIKMVLAFLRTYPEVIAQQSIEEEKPQLASAKPAKKSPTPTLQWLESEDESSQIMARKKGEGSTPTTNLQWLESEAERDSAITK